MKFFYLSISVLVVASVVSLSLAGPLQHPEEISWEEFKVSFILFPNYLSYHIENNFFLIFARQSTAKSTALPRRRHFEGKTLNAH